ncbi:hypothetical protein EDB84DRAFT_1512321 [Lactarius hengduanensis]|nr:hypothetical protein EDB84DRAFT_1512321 [Lactarius hengduanensis]
MSTVQSPDLSPHIINGIYRVASHHVGMSLVGVVRNCFTRGKIRRGDYYFGRVHPLIQQHYAQLELDDQNTIDFEFTQTSLARDKMETADGSIFQKYSLAKDYKRVAKHLFIVVDRRTCRKNLMAQISEAIAARATQPPPLGTISTISNPFSDTHEVSSLADVDVGNLNQVEMSTFESEASGKAAVVLELHGRDGTTQEVSVNFPLAVVSGNRTDEAETRTVSSYDTTGCVLLGPHSDAGDDAGR